MSWRALLVGLLGAVLALTGLAAPSTAAPVAAAPAGSIARTAVPPYPGVLSMGSTGAAVAAVQRGLIARKYRISERLGYYGRTTAQSVLAFKRAHPQLGTINGMVGPNTYRALTAPTGGGGGGGGGGGSTGGTGAGTYPIPRSYGSESACPTGPDPTTTVAARNSRTVRARVTVAQFVSSPMGCRVIVRESNGDCRNATNGTYFGKWQLDMQEWPYYGGTRFAATPYQATCAQQDVIAYRNWVDRYWTPWTTACWARDRCPAGRLY